MLTDYTSGWTPRRILRQLHHRGAYCLPPQVALWGWLISRWTSRLLVGFYSVDVTKDIVTFSDIRPDAIVVLYSIAVTVTAGVLFGLLPALQASNTDLTSGVENGRQVSWFQSAGGAERYWLQRKLHFPLLCW